MELPLNKQKAKIFSVYLDRQALKFYLGLGYKIYYRTRMLAKSYKHYIREIGTQRQANLKVKLVEQTHGEFLDHNRQKLSYIKFIDAISNYLAREFIKVSVFFYIDDAIKNAGKEAQPLLIQISEIKLAVKDESALAVTKDNHRSVATLFSRQVTSYKDSDMVSGPFILVVFI
ncbi:hypothetical protein RF11_05320 [Thelohanellus kitauei]|uniref:Uncharacterized protein n=1 Tax=Thelohanellus kitauei TaxID=669202 RepID=A0A0C2J930_THEKT|nr:hypothetical protein RF11_05320 [Thelohanellus kitauei]